MTVLPISLEKLEIAERFTGLFLEENYLNECKEAFIWGVGEKLEYKDDFVRNIHILSNNSRSKDN